jgi:hypothetical protein
MRASGAWCAVVCAVLYSVVMGVNCYAMGGGEPQQPVEQGRELWRQEQQTGAVDPEERQLRGPRQTNGGFLDIGVDDDPMARQTLTGVVDKVGEEHFLIVDGETFRLEFDDEGLIDAMVGREVNVRGTISEGTIHGDMVRPAER